MQASARTDSASDWTYSTRAFVLLPHTDLVSYSTHSKPESDRLQTHVDSVFLKKRSTLVSVRFPLRMDLVSFHLRPSQESDHHLLPNQVYVLRKRKDLVCDWA